MLAERFHQRKASSTFSGQFQERFQSGPNNLVVMVLLLCHFFISVAVQANSALAVTFTTTQFTNNDYSDVQPQINDNGWIVWQRNQIEVLLYNGSTTIQLTDWGVGPQINNKGWVVWHGYGVKPYSEIFLYNGSTTTQLTDNDYVELSCQINDLGSVVWTGWDGHDYEIFLYNGSTTIQLTNNDYDDWAPQINNNGWVVWFASDGHDYEIFLFNGSIVSQFTNNDYDDVSPAINDNGWIVWDIGEFFLLYDGNTTIQLPNNSAGGMPQINNNGWVVWHGGDVDNEIFLYDGNTTIQITSNDYEDAAPQINNNGWVVWFAEGSGAEAEIFLAVPNPPDDSFSWPVDPENQTLGHYGSCKEWGTDPSGCYWLSDSSQDRRSTWLDVQPFQDHYYTTPRKVYGWHLGADYNLGTGAADKDLPVYPTSNGFIPPNGILEAVPCWGNIVFVQHDTSFGTFTSMYAHVRWTADGPPQEGPISIDKPIALIGNGSEGLRKSCPQPYPYHLHFEIREGNDITPGKGYTPEKLTEPVGPEGQIDPNAFLSAHH